jgi:hypothetical protein
MHITIPYTIANPEEFVALKVRLRTLLGMPAALIPHTLPLLRDNLLITGSKMRNWLYDNGYWVRVGVSNTLAIEKRKVYDPEYKTYQKPLSQMLSTKDWMP